MHPKLMVNNKINIPALFLLITLCFSCTGSVNPFQDLPEECEKCEIEFQKHTEINSCGYSDFKENISVKEFYRNLKKIPFKILSDEFGIGATNDADVYIFENHKTIFNIGIWFYDDTIIISYNREYYTTECNNMDFLFK